MQEKLIREFRTRLSLYGHLEGEVIFILKQKLAKTDIKYHSITSRVKELDSFLDKAARKELNNPLEEIHDIVGVRIVCLFLSDIERIGSLIREAFSVVSEDNKVEGADVSSFGYMSVHFVVSMKQTYSGPRYDSIAKLVFEIQVRTIAMDAWANVSHHLNYKNDKDVPSELRRDFYALSGLFYVADKHFEMFYGASTQSKRQMSELFEVATSDTKANQEINLDSLSAYLQSTFPNRVHLDTKTVSILVSDLKEAGYETIGEIDRLVEQTKEAFQVYEDEISSTSKGRPFKFADVGVVRVSTEIATGKIRARGSRRKNTR